MGLQHSWAGRITQLAILIANSRVSSFFAVLSPIHPLDHLESYRGILINQTYQSPAALGCSYLLSIWRLSVEIKASSCEFHPATPRGMNRGVTFRSRLWVELGVYFLSVYMFGPSSWSSTQYCLYRPLVASISDIVRTMVEKAVSIASTTPPSSWKGWLWDSADVSKEERRFLLKVGCPSIQLPIKGPLF